jgi:hypothetical protein
MYLSHDILIVILNPKKTKASAEERGWLLCIRKSLRIYKLLFVQSRVLSICHYNFSQMSTICTPYSIKIRAVLEFAQRWVRKF